MKKTWFFGIAVLLGLLGLFGNGCAGFKIIHPGSLNQPKIVNLATTDQKFGVSFGFVQKIETPRESAEDLYLQLNEPQTLKRLEETKSLELRIWVFNPKEVPYELRKAVCNFELPANCVESSVYKGRNVHKTFQLEAPLNELGKTKIIRAQLFDGRLPFPNLIIGDGIYTIPKKEVVDTKLSIQP